MLDIPLLLEQREKHHVDYTVVVTASAETQERRVLGRKNMTPEKFESILAKQLPDKDKRKMADFIINTDYEGYEEAKHQTALCIEDVVQRHSSCFDTWKSRKPISISETIENEACDMYLRRAFDMVVFDLDDTLAPLMGPISTARHNFEEFLKQHFPDSCSSLVEHMPSIMQKLSQEHPLLSHDYSELRRLALLPLCKTNQDHESVSKALDVFSAARSAVDQHLYPDVIPCIEHIQSQGLQVGLFTNGSAVVPARGSNNCITNSYSNNSNDRINSSNSDGSVLSNYLSLSLNARDVGAKKPSIVPFLSISQLSGVAPSRILYVGDNFEHDVLASKRANFVAAHLRRHDSKPPGHRESGDAPHVELTSLRPEEFERKMRAFIDEHVA